MANKILVAGSTNIYLVLPTPYIPAPGETLISDGLYAFTPGGKGANQAVAVARLSAKRGACVFIAKVGDDLFGRESAERFRKDAIDAKLVVDKKNASGTALILVDSKGQNVISVALGANGTLTPKDICPFEADIASAAALLMQLETPVDTIQRAAEVAHAAGVPVVLNPAPARKLPRKLLGLVDWITPNETEAEILTGVKVKDAKSAQRAADALKRAGVGHVLITMGSKGVYCAECGKLFPCRKVKAVDCVAAGDTFNGAFVVALAEGRSVSEAIEFAQRAAGISVTRPGAQSSVPFRRELAARA